MHTFPTPEHLTNIVVVINLQEGCDGGIRWCGRATEEHMHRDKNYKKVVVVMEGSGGVLESGGDKG